jgi:aspartokinase-like uncharacterized kinase
VIDVVIKVGGSLSRGDNLRILCRRLAALGSQYRLLVVPGGGPFADTVREYDNRFRLTKTASHWMAVLAMDQFGYLLSDLIPYSEPVRGLETACEIALAGRIPVLLPGDLLRKADSLPHSWKVTSDSISAWVTKLAGVTRLVLLKDVDGLYINGPTRNGDRTLVDHITFDQLAACDGVDPYLSTLIGDGCLDLWIINGNKPRRMEELLAKGRTRGTHFLRSIPSSALPSDGPHDR